MRENWEKVLISKNATIKEVLEVISNDSYRIALVVGSSRELLGTITDGDIRRALEKNGNKIFDQTADNLMSKDPKWISSDTLAISALELMQKHSITSLFVLSDINLKKPDGVIHIHDILKTGIQ